MRDTKYKIGDMVRVLEDNPQSSRYYKNEIIKVIDIRIRDDGSRSCILEVGRMLNNRGTRYSGKWIVDDHYLELYIEPVQLPEDLFEL